ncbi:hypothetical protein CKO51_31350 [Rhodopirellula sp. SM50]|nr:hypothetical protein [Rhodopirellula sp. SM50]PAY15544.1 hypothetical protein CKO51_31350 [Rhodopirellula sp. SM50]
MRILIKGLTGILVMALILPCIKPVEAQEQLADVTLEQALSAPPQHLAKGYLVVKAMIPLARLAQQGATIQRSLNDADDVINSANADDELRSLENRLSIYEQAIRRRGFT